MEAEVQHKSPILAIIGYSFNVIQCMQTFKRVYLHCIVMEIKQVQKSDERKTKSITVRTTLSNCKFLAKNNVSPTKLFNLAVEELKNKEK